jgi:hypothetical protein
VSASAEDRPERLQQPPTAASDSTEAGAEHVAGPFNHDGDVARHGGNATSDRATGETNGLRDGAADRGEALTHPPNHSEREASSAHDGAHQSPPHRSDSSTGARRQPLEAGDDLPGEGDDHTANPAERVTQAPRHGGSRT